MPARPDLNTGNDDRSRPAGRLYAARGNATVWIAEFMEVAEFCIAIRSSSQQKPFVNNQNSNMASKVPPKAPPAAYSAMRRPCGGRSSWAIVNIPLG
jgi:hypothetical protein